MTVIKFPRKRVQEQEPPPVTKDDFHHVVESYMWLLGAQKHLTTWRQYLKNMPLRTRSILAVVFQDIAREVARSVLQECPHDRVEDRGNAQKCQTCSAYRRSKPRDPDDMMGRVEYEDWTL